jgi:hypothetical protein
MQVNFHVAQMHGAERLCSVAAVWGCSEKVPAATGFVKNDRVEVAIGGFFYSKECQVDECVEGGLEKSGAFADSISGGRMGLSAQEAMNLQGSRGGLRCVLVWFTCPIWFIPAF